MTEGGTPPPGGDRGPRRRRHRRAVRPGTKPDADDSPDVGEPPDDDAPSGSEHDRWLHEQRPPHWE